MRTFNWNTRKIGSYYTMEVANLYNRDMMLRGNREISPRAIIFRGKKWSNISINVIFNAKSRNNTRGLVHLMEHCMFNKAWDGKPLEQVRSQLQSEGVFINAFTSAENMVFDFETNSDYGILDEYDDSILDLLKEVYSAKEYFAKASKLHRNLIKCEVTEKGFEDQKSIVLAEINQRFPNDDTNIRKILMPTSLTGRELSAIGTVEDVKNCTIDDIREISKYVLSLDSLNTIVISIPENTDISIVENYINEILDELESKPKLKKTPLYNDILGKDVYLENDFWNGGLAKSEIVNLPTEKDNTQYMIVRLPKVKTFVEKLYTKNIFMFLTLKDMMHEYFRTEYPHVYNVGCQYFRLGKEEMGFTLMCTINPEAKAEEVIEQFNKFKEWAKEGDRLKKNIVESINRGFNTYIEIMSGSVNREEIPNITNLDMFVSSDMVMLDEALNYFDKLFVNKEKSKSSDSKFITSFAKAELCPSETYINLIVADLIRQLDAAEVKILRAVAEE